MKIVFIVFVVFESIIYVYMGGLAPAQTLLGTPLYSQLQVILAFQLFLGGMMILFMDEVVTKWGFHHFGEVPHCWISGSV